MIKKFTRPFLALTIVSAFTLQAGAFALNSPFTSDAATLTETPAEPAAAANIAEALVADVEGKEVPCEEMVARIDHEIVQIDAQMEHGVEDEAVVLQQRQELVDLRLGQPCHGQVVEVMQPMVDELFCDDCLIEEVPCGCVEEPLPLDPMMGGCCAGGGGFSGGGGGGGGGGAGGGGLGLLGLAGLAGLAGLDDDDGGAPASL